MNTLKMTYCDQADLDYYTKTGNWVSLIHVEATINEVAASMEIFKRIKKEAAIYEKLASSLNAKYLKVLNLDDEKNINSLGLDPKEYKVVYTNFIGHYMMEIRIPSLNFYINFRQQRPGKDFFFYSTNGNLLDIMKLKEDLKINE